MVARPLILTAIVMGNQGVALPWAIGASLAQEPPCSAKVVSISGDGGFQFSMAELVLKRPNTTFETGSKTVVLTDLL